MGLSESRDSCTSRFPDYPLAFFSLRPAEAPMHLSTSLCGRVAVRLHQSDVPAVQRQASIGIFSHSPSAAAHAVPTLSSRCPHAMHAPWLEWCSDADRFQGTLRLDRHELHHKLEPVVAPPRSRTGGLQKGKAARTATSLDRLARRLLPSGSAAYGGCCSNVGSMRASHSLDAL